MDLHTLTITLSPRLAAELGSLDGTLTFDLPHKGIMALAAMGLKAAAADACTYARVRANADGSGSGMDQDPFDILWEKLDAISKD